MRNFALCVLAAWRRSSRLRQTGGPTYRTQRPPSGPRHPSRVPQLVEDRDVKGAEVLVDEQAGTEPPDSRDRRSVNCRCVHLLCPSESG
jgi:hypothetical protein